MQIVIKTQTSVCLLVISHGQMLFQSNLNSNDCWLSSRWGGGTKSIIIIPLTFGHS